MTAPLIQGASGVGGESISYASVNENEDHIHTFISNETVSWSISGGEKNLFIVDENTGKLSFKNSPDYETIEQLNGKTLKFITNYSSASISNNFFIELYDSENKSNQ